MKPTAVFTVCLANVMVKQPLSCPWQKIQVRIQDPMCCAGELLVKCQFCHKPSLQQNQMSSHCRKWLSARLPSSKGCWRRAGCTQLQLMFCHPVISSQMSLAMRCVAAMFTRAVSDTHGLHCLRELQQLYPASDAFINYKQLHEVRIEMLYCNVPACCL